MGWVNNRAEGNPRRPRTGLGLVLALALAGTVGAEEPLRSFGSPLPALELDGIAAHLQLGFDEALYRRLKRHSEFVITDFAAAPGRSLDLHLRQFFVTNERTRFVRDGRIPIPPPDVLLLRGSILGEADSHVFLALSPTLSQGYIERGEERFFITTLPPDPRNPWERQTVAFRRDGVPERHPRTQIRNALELPPEAGRDGRGEGGIAGDAPCLEAVVAYDADGEFFQIFNDETAASTYLVALHGAVSDIYERDTGVRLTIGFAQIWTDPASDPYTSTSPSTLLDQLRGHWNANHRDVERVAVQLLTGKNLSGGLFGIAWPDSLCSQHGYAISSGFRGFFSDPLLSKQEENWDLWVAAHMWAVVFGAARAPDSVCTIMSVCPLGQVVLEFHALNQWIISDNAAAAPCITEPIACAHFVRGDLNCDGAFDGADIDPFFLALSDFAAYRNAFPSCDAHVLGDMNSDGAFDGADIDVFFTRLGGG